jgi:hypothetical protein
VVTNVLSRLLDNSKPLGVPSNYRCIIIICRTYMDAKNEELVGDGSNVKNSKPSLKTKINQNGKTLYFK